MPKKAGELALCIVRLNSYNSTSTDEIKTTLHPT